MTKITNKMLRKVFDAFREPYKSDPAALLAMSEFIARIESGVHSVKRAEEILTNPDFVEGYITPFRIMKEDSFFQTILDTTASVSERTEIGTKVDNIERSVQALTDLLRNISTIPAALGDKIGSALDTLNSDITILKDNTDKESTMRVSLKAGWITSGAIGTISFFAGLGGAAFYDQNWSLTAQQMRLNAEQAATCPPAELRDRLSDDEVNPIPSPTDSAPHSRAPSNRPVNE